MKIGIDSYCYHRYLGEIYPFQETTSRRMTFPEVIRRAKELGGDGVSLETCFLPEDEAGLQAIRRSLDETGLEVLLAWGHPDGFEGGSRPEMMKDLEKHLRLCEILGTSVMRVVGSSLAFRHEPHGPQIERLIRLFREITPQAQDRGITLGIENHLDFSSREILEIVDGVASPHFGITMDTGNALRNGENPVDVARAFAGRIVATHIKDVLPLYGGNPADWYFFACVPIGRGIIDFPALLKALEEGGYHDLLAVEIDYLHPDFGEEDAAVEESIKYLKKYRDGSGGR
ncbi:MAG TPA: sugar phosphate isomerase/epimerase family protein [Atribacteraceae bacterium]|nr:sugar phosphate isomerase/epimerase family protein [Atribacteraceae bacterium]